MDGSFPPAKPAYSPEALRKAQAAGIPIEMFAALSALDATVAPVFAGRSWVPNDWDLSDSIALANEHRLRTEDY